MRADEIAGALDGLGSAQGRKNNPAPPSDSATVATVTNFTIARSNNAKSPLSGHLYAVMDFRVEECSSAATPPGAEICVFLNGLDSKMNQGSLARTNQEALRRLLAAAFHADPNGDAPGVPATPDNPTPAQGWPAVAGFVAANPNQIIGRKVRIVTSTAKPGKPVYPDQMQFFPV